MQDGILWAYYEKRLKTSTEENKSEEKEDEIDRIKD